MPWSRCCPGLEPPGPGCRDLSNVEVFVGSLDDVPAEPVYDLVVVVGVLEYVGEGSADLGPQRAFLRQIEGVLRPGGSLLLAIENKLGVKYLAGAGEDHTGKVYDSVEGYPAGHDSRGPFLGRNSPSCSRALG